MEEIGGDTEWVTYILFQHVIGTTYITICKPPYRLVNTTESMGITPVIMIANII